jgi:hypothetical protein
MIHHPLLTKFKINAVFLKRFVDKGSKNCIKHFVKNVANYILLENRTSFFP